MAGKKDIVEQALKLVMGGAEKAAPKVVGTDAAGRPMLDFRGAVVSHFTDPESAADIWSHGYRQVGDGYYGRAVSFTPNREYGRQFGGVETNAIVSPEAKILDSGNPEHSEIIQRVLNDRSLAPTNPRPGQKTWDQKFRELGYDGLYDPGAGDLFIYNPAKVKPLPPEKASGGRIAKGPGGWLDDVVKMAGKVISGEGEEAAKAGIRAYHGSPHDFPAERLVRMPSGQTEYLVGQPDVLPDVPEGAEVLQDFPLGRMRMDKIGTGVGAPDAFSRGLYFSEAEKNAQHFKELGASPMIGGRKSRAAELSPDANEAVWNFVHAQGKSGTLADVAAEAEADLAARAKELPFSARRDYQRVIDELKARGQEDVRLGAHMYEVDINADPASFAEWDTPISQQSEIVQNALSEFPKEKTWRDVYESGRIRPSDMLKRGVSGTEFKANDGTRNYVVFDDKLISIIRKYGIAGASAMLGYNLMEQLDPKQALAASMADQDYQASRPQRSMGGNNSISGALNVARGLNGVE